MNKLSDVWQTAQTPDPVTAAPAVAKANPAEGAASTKPVEAARTQSFPSQSLLRERLVTLIAGLLPSLPLPEFQERLHQISEVRVALALPEWVSDHIKWCVQVHATG